MVAVIYIIHVYQVYPFHVTSSKPRFTTFHVTRTKSWLRTASITHMGWYKGLNVKKNFFYARDRLVETYMWSVSVYFEPHYARARSFLTKITTLLSFTDDTYDAYGTIEELRPFTEAMQRF
ncbi:putative Delta-cadinene synthase isozyme A [Tripterygium wilfordii]|uniref:Putative Delta-cadinene synthase isozyme A n=1 Tax=Tripterygium wilfordii TaxID=458696 RepID=A0A7J7DYL1_TRIWF|nr:putative Delta-cadinene synthase isozyme A [Tripterygium wilfordii]